MSQLRNIVAQMFGVPLAETLAACRTRVRGEWRLRQAHRQGCAKAHTLVGASPLRLHLGCGHHYKPHWVNIDAYYLPPCTPDLTLDLRLPLPFPDHSCVEVYSEHFFEHIPYPRDAAAILRDTWRVLTPGGRTSIGVPDPRPVLQAYLSGEPAPYFEYFLTHPSVTRHLQTRMEAVNWLFKQGGEHQFIYDFLSLQKMLAHAGFTRIERREFDSTRDSEVRRHETIYVDAWKNA